jgi:DNA-directed RNA polymerase specialized sigma24 family protein
MTADETATALQISKRTVEREWQKAKAQLRHEIRSGKE